MKDLRQRTSWFGFVEDLNNDCRAPKRNSGWRDPKVRRAGASLFLAIVLGREPAEAATQEQQRHVALVGIRFHRTKKDHMISAIEAVHGSAVKSSHALGKQRRSTKTRGPIDASKLVLG